CHPVGWCVSFRLRLEGAGTLYDGIEPRANVGKSLGIKAAARMADVDESVALEYAEDEGSQASPASAWLGEAADYRLLALVCFDLEPGLAPKALPVLARSFLGDDSFQAFLFNRLEERLAILLDMFAHQDIWQPVYKLCEQFLPAPK